MIATKTVFILALTAFLAKQIVNNMLISPKGANERIEFAIHLTLHQQTLYSYNVILSVFCSKESFHFYHDEELPYHL